MSLLFKKSKNTGNHPDTNTFDRYFNSVEDVFQFLDAQASALCPQNWDAMYAKRERPAPFVVQKELPDENLVAFLREYSVATAIEFGCGEGRNAIYMAQQGVRVTAADCSVVAIQNAKTIAQQKQTAVEFCCCDALQTQWEVQDFDFVYDSGMFHHLAPHRRLTYLEKVIRLLKPQGYFGLTCFAQGENCADEVDDWEYYKQFRGGIAFSKDRLSAFFGSHFTVLEIRKYETGIPETIQDLGFMWVCLFQKK